MSTRQTRPPAAFFVILGGAGVSLVLFLYLESRPRSSPAVDWFQLVTLSLTGIAALVFILWERRHKR